MAYLCRRNVPRQFRTNLLKSINSMRRLKEQLPAQRDVVDRLKIRAPRSGRVVNLQFHTAGGVINPSTPILDIVPEDAQLLIEAKVKPVDIDILEPGMEAQITLTAYSTRKHTTRARETAAGLSRQRR